MKCLWFTTFVAPGAAAAELEQRRMTYGQDKHGVPKGLTEVRVECLSMVRLMRVLRLCAVASMHTPFQGVLHEGYCTKYIF